MDDRSQQSGHDVTEELRRLRKQVDSLAGQLELTRRRLDQLEGIAHTSHAPAPAAPPRSAEPVADLEQKPTAVSAPAVPPPLPPQWSAARAASPAPPKPVRPLREESAPPPWDGPYFPERAPQAAEFSLERSIGAHWTSWVGGLIVFLGVCFFLKYAWDQGWLRPSPQARVAGALLFGAALLGLGEFLFRRSAIALAAALNGTGVAVIMATFLAASAYFDPPVLSTSAAFYGVAIAALIGVGIALRIDAPSLAVIALIGAYIAPAVLHSGVDRSLQLLVYLWFVAAIGCALEHPQDARARATHRAERQLARPGAAGPGGHLALVCALAAGRAGPPRQARAELSHRRVRPVRHNLPADLPARGGGDE